MIDIELPEWLEDITEDSLLKEMLDDIPDDLDKSEGSYIWDSLSPVAIKFAKTAEWLKEAIRRVFPHYTFGEYLDLRADEEGLVRRPPVQSTGEVIFEGVSGTVIPLGTRVSTPSDVSDPSVEFKTTEEAVLDSSGSAIVPIISVLAGVKANVEPDTISIIVSNDLEGVSVRNDTKTSGGFDEEDDDSLRLRIFENSQKDEGDGNVDDYIVWAKEIAGVGNVLVEAHWNGVGTMRVVILDQNGSAATEELINSVQEHLDPGIRGIGEGRAPVGSKTTVDTAAVKSISATIPNLVAETGYTIEQAKTNGEAALRNYLNNINPGGVIRVREAEAELINATGVLDMGDLLLNGSRSNITLSTTELSDLGDVMYS